MQRFITKTKDGVKLLIDQKVYALPTIYSAAYIFLDKAYVYLDKEKEKTVVWLFPKNKKANLDILGKEFLNELINYSHYFSSLKANAEAIKMLMQRALFSASPSLVQEAEEKEIQDLISELEEEEKKEAKPRK